MNKLLLFKSLCILYLEINFANTFQQINMDIKNINDHKEEEIGHKNARQKRTFVYPDNNDANDSCILPDGKTGECKNIKNCSYALNLLREQKQPQLCGFDAKDPVVCCIPTLSRSIKNRKKFGELSLRKCIEFRTKSKDKLAYLNKLYRILKEKTPLGKISKYVKSIFRFLQRWSFFWTWNVSHALPSVSGGEQSEPKEFPHMAAIGYGNPNNIVWACGGTLISEKFVLTAAHCLYSRNLGPARYVRLGDLDLSIIYDDAEPQDFLIKQKIPHPNYAPPAKYHDIALLELEKSINRTEYVDVACLDTERTHHDTYLTATGWGKTDPAGLPSSFLLKVPLEVIAQNKCQFGYRRERGSLSLPNGIVDDMMLCAGGEGDTCQGDSGGPLVAHQKEKFGFRTLYTVVGVTSFGKPCGIGKVPGVYTRVFSYLEWVEKIVWPDE